MSKGAGDSGLVVVDKPEGPSSFAVVARVRKIMGTRDVGHCGTLDPLASGVLVVVVGTWTRLVRVLTADDKSYRAIVAFGTRTSTDDREGEVVSRASLEEVRARVSHATIETTLAAMVGPTLQVPPAYSAIHVGGQRAYERVRRGEDVQMAPRPVVLHSLRLCGIEDTGTEVRVIIDVTCGKGTYVRAIARDLGDAMGLPAHLHALRRTASGPHTLSDAVPLDALAPSSLRSGVAALRGVATMEVTDPMAQALRQGRRVPCPVRPNGATAPAGTFLAHIGDDLVALVHEDGGQLVVERGFAAS